MTDSDTIRMLEEAVRSGASFDAKRVRSWRDNPPGFDRSQWQVMAEQGWLSIVVPEADGGLGLDIDAAATVAEGLGAAAAPEPFVAGGIVPAKLLASCHASDVRDSALAGIVSGTTIACVAYQDVSGALATGPSAIVARNDGGTLHLSGELRFVDIPDADAFIVPVMIDEGGAQGPSNICRAALIWVEAASDGLTMERETAADGSAMGWLRLSDVRLPASACLAEGDIWPIFEEAIDYGTIGNCAELLGNMDRCLELTLDYLKTRSQFGQQIGRFQVLQHRAVDLWMNAQVARHAFNASLRQIMAPGAPADARSQAASSAKARVARTALDVGNDAIQLHGAIGFTDEYDLALYVNRAIAIAPQFGNAADHLKRYGDLKQRRTEASL